MPPPEGPGDVHRDDRVTESMEWPAEISNVYGRLGAEIVPARSAEVVERSERRVRDGLELPIVLTARHRIRMRVLPPADLVTLRPVARAVVQVIPRPSAAAI